MGIFDFAKDFYSFDTEGMADFFTGAQGAEDRAKDFYNKSEEARRNKTAGQFGYIDQMKGPSMTPQMAARLRALEDESRPGPLVTDATFQGHRDALVRGGQAALSNVQQNQRAANVQGGFANTGSIQDVYDRLGAGLAQLGQQSAQVKGEKADRAAQARQQYQDATIAFENSKTEARRAIAAGDADAAQRALSGMYAAQEAVEQSKQAFQRYMTMELPMTVLGGMYGGPMGAQAGQQAGQGANKAAQSGGNPAQAGGAASGGGYQNYGPGPELNPNYGGGGANYGGYGLPYQYQKAGRYA